MVKYFQRFSEKLESTYKPTISRKIKSDIADYNQYRDYNKYFNKYLTFHNPLLAVDKEYGVNNLFFGISDSDIIMKFLNSIVDNIIFEPNKSLNYDKHFILIAFLNNNRDELLDIYTDNVYSKDIITYHYEFDEDDYMQIERNKRISLKDRILEIKKNYNSSVKKDKYLYYFYLYECYYIVPDKYAADKENYISLYKKSKFGLPHNSHANCIILDLRKNLFEFYEPHGVYDDNEYDDKYSIFYSNVQKYYKKLAKEVGMYYKSNRGGDGLQSIYSNLKEDVGVCQVITLYYLFIRLIQPYIDPDIIKHKLLLESIYNPDYFVNTITNFSKIIISMVEYYNLLKYSENYFYEDDYVIKKVINIIFGRNNTLFYTT